ncbi:hypothetical protein [Spirosoma luteum]|uniref:hypothetical protein n=1 Tax=Spirosoma luteum TaxID=431553 RepID=UPI00037ECB91|nr:hypothetical protein [Spirosoma luteum]
MPIEITTTGPFDLTFDDTFGGVLIGTGSPSVAYECRSAGAYLTWLSPVGWMYWLYEGPMNTQKAVRTAGAYQQAGTTRYTQKESNLLLTVRTIGLSKAEVDAVATVYDSIGVFLLAVDTAGVFHRVPVSVEPGTFDLYSSRENVHDLTLTISLPARRSARG